MEQNRVCVCVCGGGRVVDSDKSPIRYTKINKGPERLEQKKEEKFNDQCICGEKFNTTLY